MKGTNVASQLVHFARTQSEFLFGQYDNGTPFRRFVGERAQLCRCREVVRLDARRGMKRDRHTIAERDGAGFVEQQHIDISSGFDRASAHRQHIALKYAIHPGDADGAEQPADRRGNQTNQQRRSEPEWKITVARE